jgi:hypothetical protein
VAALTVTPTFGNVLDIDHFNYTPGTLLSGQGGWVLKSAAENGQIEAGNLDVPGLEPSSGNRYTFTGNNSVRFLFDPPQTNSSIWFSFALRVDNPSTSTGSETTAGLAQGTTTSFPCKVNLVGDGTGSYRIGMFKGGGTTGNGSIAPNVFTAADTVFVVGRYTFRPGTTTDDSGDLWLNPAQSTFGELAAPTPTLADQGAGVNDQPFTDAFMWRFASGYPKRTVDEFRLGYSWADVTPPTQPLLSVAATNGNSVVLFWNTNTPLSFHLQFRNGLFDDDGWQSEGTTPSIQGVNYTVTLPASGSKFYRLIK